MNKKSSAIFAALVISLTIAASIQFAVAVPVFSDNFSSDNFAGWSQTYLSPGSTQTVSNGIARFTVPTPLAGTSTYSFLKKDGFTSTVNSTITAAQDVYVTKVPNGCQLGNGAIFFLYVCDSSDISGNQGNVGVGIDGSGVWSLWIGGTSAYNYTFQTAGAAPASNTWYHVELTINNSAGTVALAVNGLVVISAAQQQFTDRTHAVSLMVGMGEDWWSAGSGQQEVDVDNVVLSISDATSTPAPTTLPTPASTPTPNLPTQTPTATPDPTATTKPTPKPTPTQPPQPTALPNQPDDSSPPDFPSWILLPATILAVAAAFLAVGIMLKKR
ncbi:MAG: LamG domain-containing protein [Chloroflexi bacterium]|nr:LamG domain-containing protein [Chloroflexota bacterium]